MAAQTAKGAASLLADRKNHPESEVDKVTTPRGCTITGLNQMEHNGFSSALIKGIIISAEKASKLYRMIRAYFYSSCGLDSREIFPFSSMVIIILLGRQQISQSSIKSNFEETVRSTHTEL